MSNVSLENLKKRVSDLESSYKRSRTIIIELSDKVEALEKDQESFELTNERLSRIVQILRQQGWEV